MRHLPSALVFVAFSLVPATAAAYCGLSQADYESLNDRNRERIERFEERVGQLIRRTPSEDEAQEIIKTLVELSFNAYICGELDEEFDLAQDERVECVVNGPAGVFDRLEEEHREALVKTLRASTDSVQRVYQEEGWDEALTTIWDLRQGAFDQASGDR